MVWEDTGREEEAGRTRTGAHSQKQEPHTKTWGMMTIHHHDVVFLRIYIAKLAINHGIYGDVRPFN